MKCCLVRKVSFRLPGTNRLVWAIVLSEREGLALLFVRKPDDNYSHSIVIARENVAERIFEISNASGFPFETRDMIEIGSILETLGHGLQKSEFDGLFDGEPEDSGVA